MNVLIRKGYKSDLPMVLDLIKELASYENSAEEVILTVEDLERDGFAEHPVFNFFVAENNKEIIGLALYYVKYSTWKGKCVFLEDIIVTEQFRNQGVGKKLFDEVVEAAKKMNVQRLEWQVLDWNKPAIKFYEKLNSLFDTNWINCKITKEQIEKY